MRNVSFKVKKALLSRQGFDPGILKDEIYAMLPGEKEYIPLTAELYQKVTNRKYRY